MKTRTLAALILLLTSVSVFAQDDPNAVNSVTVAAIADAAETGQSPGTFRFTFVQAKQTACTINFSVTGDPAANNYQPLGTTIVMPGGGATTTVDLDVVPIDNQIVDGTRNVTVTVNSTSCPSIDPGTPNNDSVSIADNDAYLTLTKTVDGGPLAQDDFPSFVDGSPQAWDVRTVLTEGAHTASEDSQPNYMEGAWGGNCAANGNVTLVAGDDKTCSITNTYVPPTTTTTTAATTTTTTAAPTTTTTAAPTTTTTAAPTTTTTAAPTTTTTAAPTTTTTAGSTTTTTAGSTTTTTAAPTTTTTAGSTTTTTAGSTTTTTAGSTTTTTAGSTTTTAVATTTTTTTAAPTTTTTLPPGTEELTLVKTADPSTFVIEGVTINYSYLVTSTGNTAVIGPITVTDSRMTVDCPLVATLEVLDSLTCTSSLVTTLADVNLGYILTTSFAQGANVSSDDVETNVRYADPTGIPTLSEWSMIMLSFLFLLMGVGYLRKRKMI